MTREELMEEYVELYDQSRVLQARMDEIREELSKHVNYARRELKHGPLTIRYTKGYGQVQWDRNKLEMLARKYPDILEARSTKHIKPKRSFYVGRTQCTA